MLKDNEKKLEDKIRKLQLELYKEYEDHGHSERVIKISQELDKYILMMQKKKIKRE